MNFRHAKPEDFAAGQPNFATIDVSFISLRLILAPLIAILEDGGDVCALIKPQFEAGKGQVGKKGIVRDPEIHKQVISEIVDFAMQLGFTTMQLDFSPITGGEGNVEFLLHLRKGNTKQQITATEIESTVSASQMLKND